MKQIGERKVQAAQFLTISLTSCAHSHCRVLRARFEEIHAFNIFPKGKMTTFQYFIRFQSALEHSPLFTKVSVSLPVSFFLSNCNHLNFIVWISYHNNHIPLANLNFHNSFSNKLLLAYSHQKSRSTNIQHSLTPMKLKIASTSGKLKSSHHVEHTTCSVWSKCYEIMALSLIYTYPKWKNIETLT